MYVVVDWVAIGVAITLFLIGVVLAIWPFATTEGPRTSTKVMLVFLRLAIAWHFFIEGAEKLHQASWSSESYLRESTGPLAPTFRELAGDRLLDRLTLTSDDKFPEALDLEWQSYLEAFEGFYRLDAEQSKRAGLALEQTKSDMARLLSKQRLKTVEKIAPYPPTLTVNLTMPERIAEYHKLQDKVREAEEKLLLPYGGEAVDEWKTVKANANRWRAGLQRDLASVNKEMKRTLQNLLLDFAGENLPPAAQKKVQEKLNDIQKKSLTEITVAMSAARPGEPKETNWDDIDRVKDKWTEKTAEVYRDAFDAQKRKDAEAASAELTVRVVENVLEKRKKNLPSVEPVPYAVSKPVRYWTLLDFSDFAVKYGVFTVGLLLLIGLFTRTACVVGAAYLLLFYLAMPPLPGWPESPRTEGHYLFVNKTIIEMLALSVLATTRSGCWAGLDALLQFLRPARWRRNAVPVTMEKVAV